MDIQRQQIINILIDRVKADPLTVESLSEMVLNKMVFDTNYSEKLDRYITRLIEVINANTD